LDPVTLQAVRLAYRLDHHPGVLRGRIMFDNYRPQGIARSHDMGAARLVRPSLRAGVEDAGDNGRQKRGYDPPPTIYVCLSHPGRIKDERSFPNSFFEGSPPLALKLNNRIVK
jgi:hypothetical protein